MAYSQQFMRAINFALGIEGVLSLDPKDPGNWTGGAIGKGELVGTKWGISAAQYPQLDIKNLSRESAVAIYARDYWAKIRGDDLPSRLAICVLDSAINQGVETAVKLLQSALKIETDGVLGSQTIAAVRAVEQDHLIVYSLAKRSLRYAKTKNFDTDGEGWTRRLFFACMEASR